MSVAFAFIASGFVWLSFELWLNFRDRARVDATEDKSSGLHLFSLLIAALVICVIIQQTDLPRIPIGQDHRYLIGTSVVLAGAVLRWWAFWSLGKYFRTVLAIQDGQKVVDRGPYRFIRHPAYTGALLAFTGFGLGLGIWAGLAVILALSFLGYHRRIKLEEQLMITCFQAEYLRFMEKTKKLIPFIY
ncbi:MAG: isoprenylcysteine carboxylmethyltransferase family protein [Dehalococcoidales bacterium]|nr:isoprenylcysteine carboxylmethyltransferase family protein [Dehalococcoidales bacterium]